MLAVLVLACACAAPAADAKLIRDKRPGGHKLRGTNANDSIFGRGGGDRLFGLGGNDTVMVDAQEDGVFDCENIVTP